MRLLVAVLHLLQKGRGLSKGLAETIRLCIIMNVQSLVKSIRQPKGMCLVAALGLLRASKHKELVIVIQKFALSLLGMRAWSMPWVQAAAELVALRHHVTQVSHAAMADLQTLQSLATANPIAFKKIEHYDVVVCT